MDTTDERGQAGQSDDKSTSSGLVSQLAEMDDCNYAGEDDDDKGEDGDDGASIWTNSSASLRMQSVPTDLTGVKPTLPSTIFLSFCNLSTSPSTFCLCLSQVTPSMYSSELSLVTVTMNSGGFGHCLPLSLIEHLLGSTEREYFWSDINLHFYCTAHTSRHS